MSASIVKIEQSKNSLYRKRWPKLGGLQTRMTISYIWVTAIFVLLLEILNVFLYLFFITNSQAETNNFALAQRVCIQYAYAASIQSNALVLNPRTTFQPGQPYSLMPLGMRTPGENARSKFTLSNYTFPYVAESNPAQPPPAIGLVIAPNGRITASSYPARYPTNMLFSQLLPHQSSAVALAMQGTSIYAKTSPDQPDILYVAETIWGKNEQPIGVFYAQAPEEPLSFTDVLQSASSSWLTLVIIILLVLVITTPIGSLFSLMTTRNLVRRIHRLAEATTRFAKGDFRQRVPISRLDEVGQLEYDFNQMANQLVESTHQQQELAAQNARLSERARISRELHDAISQDLFSLRMLSFGLQDALPGDSDVQKQVATLERTTSRMIREMRTLLLELRPTHLQQLGLAEALKDLAASYGERLEITVTTDISPISLPTKTEHALFKVAQEALSNAVRHAHARHITLTLNQLEEGVRLAIRDDGVGFELTKNQEQHSIGLNSMQERVHELHGTFSLQSTPGEGTEINVFIPQEEKR